MEQQNSSTGATGLLDKVKSSATTQLGTQKDRATEGIGTVAQAVRQSGQQLRDQQHDTIAQYIEQAADQLEKFGTSLKDKNVTELMRDAQNLAKRRPALFIGSAFALGLLGARFLKSSGNNGTNGGWSSSSAGSFSAGMGRS